MCVCMLLMYFPIARAFQTGTGVRPADLPGQIFSYPVAKESGSRWVLLVIGGGGGGEN
jgi:hypothetical protein